MFNTKTVANIGFHPDFLDFLLKSQETGGQECMKAVFGLQICWMTWMDDRTEIDPVDGSVEICRVYAHRLDAGAGEVAEGDGCDFTQFCLAFLCFWPYFFLLCLAVLPLLFLISCCSGGGGRHMRRYPPPPPHHRPTHTSCLPRGHL